MVNIIAVQTETSFCTGTLYIVHVPCKFTFTHNVCAFEIHGGILFSGHMVELISNSPPKHTQGGEHRN